MLVSSKLAEEMAKKIVRKNNCPIELASASIIPSVQIK